jgi:ligand-binding sensor domain-containing protein/two-component sensor histidine kinase
MPYNVYGEQPVLTKSRLSALLQQPTVSAIHRDAAGILWIGTQQGLHRYDGANLTIFNSHESNNNWIPESEIKDIAEDSEGNLFIATSSGGLLKWNPSLATFDSLIPFSLIGTTKIIRLLISMDGNIWMLRKDGLNIYKQISDTSIPWKLNKELLEVIGIPRDIVEDTSGNLWLAGDAGIACILANEKMLRVFDTTSLGLPEGSSLTALEFFHDNRLVIGTDTGEIIIWDTESRKSLANAKLKNENQIYVSKFLMYEDRLIIGTDRGLYSSDRHLSYFNGLGDSEGGLSNPNIYSLFKDGKYIWVGTIDGLDILSFSPIELFNTNNSGISDDILAFEEDFDGQLWVGTYDGLYSYNESTGSHSKLTIKGKAKTYDQSISTLAAEKSTLLMGMLRGGVMVLDTITKNSRAQKLNNISDSGITKILVIDENDETLVATYERGLFRIAGGVTKSYYEDGTLPEKSITLLFRSNTGVVFAASGNMLYQHVSYADQYRRIPLEFGLGGKDPFLYSLNQTINNDILIGTKDHGLFVWTQIQQARNDFEVQPFAGRENINNSTVYGIELDSEGSVWCSTENGILKLDSAGKLQKRFTLVDGLQGNDFTLGASFKSQAGLIYFGGMNGYNRFDPNQIKIDSSASPMRMTGISFPEEDDSRRLNGLPDIKNLQLTHKDHFVSFQFSVLDFIDAEKNQFRYKLENFDTNWIESGSRNTATYTNLPAGNYVLRVQGANSAGIWNREGIKLDIQVLPAPWQTWWAYIIYCVALLSLGWGLHRIYHSYAIDRLSAQMAQEMFEAENKADDEMQEQLELQDEIVNAAYQHNITTLSLVSDFISARSINLPDNIKRSLTESSIRRVSALSSLEDCLSYQAGGQVANLRKYTDLILLALLTDSPVRPETIVAINEVTSMPLSADLASPISIILYELLENSIQHAFLHDSPANYIHVKLAPGTTDKPFSRNLYLSVQDSGIGVAEDIEHLAGKGSGISIVQAIVEKLGGSLHFSGENGTLVLIELPDNS